VYTALHQWFDLGNAYALITGLGLILTAILNPSGIAGETRHQVEWVTRKLRGSRSLPPPRGPAEPAVTPSPPVETPRMTTGV
jgi:branched-chain amino acid transport system permease protein